MKYAVGIDVGGTNTRVALINENYEIVDRFQFSTDPDEPMNTLKKIKNSIDDFDCQIEGIGLSCPGPLDLVNQSILTPPNLPGWHNFKVSEELNKLTHKRVVLENDANLAGLAEAVIGRGKNCSHVQFLTVSTGLGAGFVVDKKIYIGSKGFAMEVANSILWKNGPSQNDLKEGSVESICSGTAITKRAKEAGLDVEHAGQVNDLALQGNAVAKDIMEDAYEYLANFVGILYGVLDPDIFVLGGSVALKIEGFVQEVERRAKEKVYPILSDNIKLEKAELGEDSGLLGAACLILA